MKIVKKISALVLALVMCMGVSVTAFAASSPETKGSITVSGVAEESYSIYKLFDMTYSDSADSYSYKVVSAWESFIKSYEFEGGTTFTLDKNGCVTNANEILELSDSAIAQFAKDALYYAEANGIAATDTKTATAAAGAEADPETGAVPGTAAFTGLDLGWYLVSSSLGTLCMLDSITPDWEIEEKNAAPSLSKYVMDITDKDKDDSYVGENDADVTDTLQYEIVISDAANGHNLCVHDYMDPELQLTYTGSEANIAVYVGAPSSTNQAISAEGNYIITIYVEGDTHAEGDTCTFEISFTDEFLATLSDSDDLYIIYTVTIDAKDDSFDESDLQKDAEEWKNHAYLTYATAQKTPEAETNTYSYGIEIFKYTIAADEEKPLADAAFILKYVNENGITNYATLEYETGANIYLLTGWVTDENEATAVKTASDGMLYIEGLAHDVTYYLEETAAPDGYNMLTDDITVTISLITADDPTGASYSSFTVNYTYNDEDGSGMIKVLNINSGSSNPLPGTGGIGTTIFYIAGGAIVLAAVVILITRRRMSRSEG